jgi:bifunctional polynucleotide phosphatase/kinase
MELNSRYICVNQSKEGTQSKLTVEPNMAPVIIQLMKPRFRKKVGAFDYDWCLVKPLNGRTHAKDVNDQQWLRPSVPEVLKSYYDKGFGIVIISNQTRAWKTESIRAQMATLEIPLTIAIGYDEADRKPLPTMWHAVMAGRDWDTKKSFFVGDAAGRAGDWSDSDAKFAEAVGVTFKTPEDVFPFPEREAANSPASGTAAMLDRKGTGTSASTEAIVMIGYPGSGKTTVANARFSADKYTHIDGDALKTADRMVRVAAKAPVGTSVIFDATNGDVARRAVYIAWAKSAGLPVRAVWVDVTIDVAMENAKRREAEGGNHVPRIAMYTFRKRFQEPTLEEGFDQVIKM